MEYATEVVRRLSKASNGPPANNIHLKKKIRIILDVSDFRQLPIRARVRSKKHTKLICDLNTMLVLNQDKTAAKF